MEVAEAATRVNTKKVHAPHRRCTARARSRFTSFCIRHARTSPPRHTRGTEGRGGRVGCPYAGWVHARRHGGRSPTCIVLAARADVHCARYRHAIETGFFFADSQGRVRTGQRAARAARAAGRGGWVCEWLLEMPILTVLEPKTGILSVLDLSD